MPHFDFLSAAQAAQPKVLTVPMIDEFTSVAKEFSTPIPINGIVLPDFARIVLTDRNHRNRKINRPTVETYKEELRNGWELNGESVIFDWNGDLGNGQHRFLACAETEISFVTTMSIGVDPESVMTMDSGMKRRIGQQLGLKKYHDPNNLGVACQVIMMYNTYGIIDDAAPHKFPIRAMLDFLNKNPFVSEEPLFAQRARQLHKSLTHSLGLFWGMYVIFAQINRPDADMFTERLRDGANLEQDDPVLRLREFLNKLANNRHKNKPRRDVIAAHIIKSWNAFRNGERIKLLRWYNNPDHHEGFPVAI